MLCLASFLLTGNAYPLKQYHSRYSNTLDREIDPNHFDEALLSRAIVQYTNLERSKHQLKPLTVLSTLQVTATRHSREMASLHYFSHQSPLQKNRNLTDRLVNAGFRLINVTVGENIGVDYFLQIANVPFTITMHQNRKIYTDVSTGKPIRYQTYRQFAQRMVENWMNSPAHRHNILNAKYERIGCGIAAGIYNDLKAIYVTQNFSGSLRHPSRIFQER
jgi:uncharacterized protein YkwD